MVSESVSQEPLIRLEKLNKSFSLTGGDRFDAVRDVSLTVARGDALGLIGRSGAGKSTLLRLMNLLERPDSGRVFVSGQELTALDKKGLRDARQKIGMICQQFNLLQNATVSDNIAFPLRIHGRHDRAAIAARVRECAEVVGLVDKLDHYPAQLSGGQKQRVAIARAIIALGHGMGMYVVAEGVETEAQVDFLRGYGCDQMQGYLLSKPLPADQLEQWLRARIQSQLSLNAARRAALV